MTYVNDKLAICKCISYTIYEIENLKEKCSRRKAYIEKVRKKQTKNFVKEQNYIMKLLFCKYLEPYNPKSYPQINQLTTKKNICEIYKEKKAQTKMFLIT